MTRAVAVALLCAAPVRTDASVSTIGLVSLLGELAARHNYNTITCYQTSKILKLDHHKQGS